MKKIKWYIIGFYYALIGGYSGQFIQVMQQNELLIIELEKSKKEAIKYRIQLAQLGDAINKSKEEGYHQANQERYEAENELI